MEINLQYLEEIKELINDFSGVAKEKIALNSALETDLRIYGDDVVELILIYSKKFNVDVTKFDIEGFISPEGDTLWPSIKRFFSGEKLKKKGDISVYDLVSGITTGILDPSLKSK